MIRTETDSLGNSIQGEPVIGPRGSSVRRDSLTTAALVELLTAALMAKKEQPAMTVTDDIDSIGNQQENVVPLGPRGAHAPRDSRRA